MHIEYRCSNSKKDDNLNNDQCVERDDNHILCVLWKWVKYMYELFNIFFYWFLLSAGINVKTSEIIRKIVHIRKTFISREHKYVIHSNDAIIYTLLRESDWYHKHSMSFDST